MMLLKLLSFIFLMYFVVVRSGDSNPEKKVESLDCCPLFNASEIDEFAQILNKCTTKSGLECKGYACFFKGLDVLDDNDNLNEKALKELVKKRKPSDVYDVLADFIDECFKKPPGYGSSDPSCKFSGFWECFLMLPYEMCPKTKIWNPLRLAGCDAIKKQMSNVKVFTV